MAEEEKVEEKSNEPNGGVCGGISGDYWLHTLNRLSWIHSRGHFISIRPKRLPFSRPTLVVPIVTRRIRSVGFGPCSSTTYLLSLMKAFSKQLKWMPLLVLSSKLCPPGIEGTFFALLMSIYNDGVLSSSWASGFLLHIT